MIFSILPTGNSPRAVISLERAQWLPGRAGTGSVLAKKRHGWLRQPDLCGCCIYQTGLTMESSSAVIILFLKSKFRLDLLNLLLLPLILEEYLLQILLLWDLQASLQGWIRTLSCGSRRQTKSFGASVEEWIHTRWERTTESIHCKKGCLSRIWWTGKHNSNCW